MVQEVDRQFPRVMQVLIYLTGEENVSIGKANLGPGHWSVRLLRMVGTFMGTIVPR